MTVAVAGPRAGPREWTGLVVLALPALLVSMDLTVLHLAVPEIRADLAPSPTQLLWIVDIYGFMIAGFLVTMGTLGDRIGRRRLLLTGATAFGGASLVAAYASDPAMLVAARAVLGVAGATLAPSTLALIRNMFHDPGERARAVSLWFVSFLAGAAIGPIVGGVLLSYFWWGSVFVIGAPVMAMLLVAGPALLPEYRNPSAGRLDLPSVVLSLTAVLGGVYGLKQLVAHGHSIGGYLAIVIAIALATAFVNRQNRIREPLLDLKMFTIRAFSLSVGVLTLAPFVMGGAQFLIAQYLQLELGLSPLAAGGWLLPPLMVGIATMLAAPRIVQMVRPGPLLCGSLLLAGSGFVIVCLTDGDNLTPVIIGLTVAFAGLMPASALGLTVVVDTAPPERAGAAAGISETAQEIGGALGIAVLGSVAAAVAPSSAPSAGIPLAALICASLLAVAGLSAAFALPVRATLD